MNDDAAQVSSGSTNLRPVSSLNLGDAPLRNFQHLPSDASDNLTLDQIDMIWRGNRAALASLAWQISKENNSTHITVPASIG
jgi:hypothetical protein